MKEELSGTSARRARCVRAMRLLLGLLVYLVAVIALGSGAAAVLFSAPQSGVRTATARQEATPIASPRIQAWLERKAEGVAFAEKEKAAALAERERAEALRAKLAATPTPEPYVAPRVRDDEERRSAERERAARAKESARREAKRHLRELEGYTAYGYAAEPRRPSYGDDFLTRRDRYGY
jgi:hypothetical protein